MLEELCVAGTLEELCTVGIVELLELTIGATLLEDAVTALLVPLLFCLCPQFPVSFLCRESAGRPSSPRIGGPGRPVFHHYPRHELLFPHQFHCRPGEVDVQSA